MATVAGRTKVLTRTKLPGTLFAATTSPTLDAAQLHVSYDDIQFVLQPLHVFLILGNPVRATGKNGE